MTVTSLHDSRMRAQPAPDAAPGSVAAVADVRGPRLAER
jgi:hypothetical protein